MSLVISLSGRRAAGKVVLVITEDGRDTDTPPLPAPLPLWDLMPRGAPRTSSLKMRLPTTDPPLKARGREGTCLPVDRRGERGHRQARGLVGSCEGPEGGLL